MTAGTGHDVSWRQDVILVVVCAGRSEETSGTGWPSMEATDRMASRSLCSPLLPLSSQSHLIKVTQNQQHLQAQMQQVQPQQQQQQQHQAAPQQPVHWSGSYLCRIGQETVQEIVNKTMELFKLLATCQPPNGTAAQMQFQNERKKKVAEFLDTIGGLFKRLRKICEKANEATTDMEFVQIESLIPLREAGEIRALEDKKKNSEVVRKLTDERNLYSDQLRMRNRKLKEIIDMLRDIVWDINTMLAMRKP